MNRQLNLTEQLAIAVLRGDESAAYALVDSLLEMREDASTTEEQKLKEVLRSPVNDSFEVYHWPEFLALAKRLGVSWSRPTTAITIRLVEGRAVRIEHEYQGRDRSVVIARTE